MNNTQIRQKFTTWLRLKLEHEDLDRLSYTWNLEAYKRGVYTEREVLRLIFTQLMADIDHSALLDRLLQGKDPLPEPPPKRHSYPVYPD